MYCNMSLFILSLLINYYYLILCLLFSNVYIDWTVYDLKKKVPFRIRIDMSILYIIIIIFFFSICFNSLYLYNNNSILILKYTDGVSFCAKKRNLSFGVQRGYFLKLNNEYLENR